MSQLVSTILFQRLLIELNFRGIYLKSQCPNLCARQARSCCFSVSVRICFLPITTRPLNSGIRINDFRS